jgi:S-adenosylmethionine decarboxylase
MNWEDLAPDICRQRMIVEGTIHNAFAPEEMSRYCQEITSVLGMTAVTAPVCNYDSNYGWCAYMHWKESGMHIYGWDDRKPPFFSIDIYTCKEFNPLDVVGYTEEFFGGDLIRLMWKE